MTRSDYGNLATPSLPSGRVTAYPLIMGGTLVGTISEVEQARLLLELTRRITATLDLQEVLDESLSALRRLIDFGGGSIQLVDRGALVAAATDPAPDADVRAVRIPVGQGVSGRIAESGEPCYIPDIERDSRVPPRNRRPGVTSGVRSYFGAPLIARGRVIGVIQVDSPIPDGFSESEQAVILTFVPTISAAVQNARVFASEREAHERLREIERMKDDFTAVVSHELRTPLTAILGFAETLAERAASLSPPTVGELGRRTWLAGKRLERLVSDLLEITEIERGTLSVTLRPTRVEPAIRHVAVEIGRGTHPLLLEVEPDLPQVMAEDGRLREVLARLINNARKFSPAGTPVRITACRDAGRVAITVEDRGRGIASETLPRAFEAFTQGEDAQTRSAGGLGTGLFLVRHVCEAMGVELVVDSAVGEGSRFTIRLDAAPA